MNDCIDVETFCRERLPGQKGVCGHEAGRGERMKNMGLPRLATGRDERPVIDREDSERGR